METPSSKPGMDGIEGNESGATGTMVATSPIMRSSILLLRFLAIITPLVAIVVLAVSKKTEIVNYETYLPYMPVIFVEGHIKWQYFSPLVFFMVSNIIACVYAALSMVLSIANRSGSKGLTFFLIVLDMTIMALLFSANGAATNFNVIAHTSIYKVGWAKFCDVFGYSCRFVTASIGVSMFGSLIFFLLIVLSMVNLYKNLI
ncbi:hypothetical protein IFM89_006597 [Coptis chinensis]|uniref:CASP-like protein n=1 Tax=Coptis chinensis TaxID=261450 RepID=A0A835IKA4_9MAGN|nr:hypothetical protein IFM89_006597 [Coptis chinensis]